MSNEIQKHEELKQCAIHAYGKNKNLPVNYKLTNTFINNHNGFSASILKKDNEIIIYPDKIINYINLDDYKVITNNTHNQIGTCYSLSTKPGGVNDHAVEAMERIKIRQKFNQNQYGKREIYKYLTPKEVHTGSCSGSYPVSGYTRSDGKEVKSYIRTCYKHSSTLRSYVGKSYSEMSDSEKDEFLNDYI